MDGPVTVLTHTTIAFTFTFESLISLTIKHVPYRSLLVFCLAASFKSPVRSALRTGSLAFTLRMRLSIRPFRAESVRNLIIFGRHCQRGLESRRFCEALSLFSRMLDKLNQVKVNCRMTSTGMPDTASIYCKHLPVVYLLDV